MSGEMAAIPVPTADSAVFWQRCKAGELAVPRCLQCGELNWFPRAMCRRCSSTNLEWVRLSGHGTLYSFSVVERPPSADLPPRYVLALVDLDEGVRLLTHVVGCDPGAVRIGMRVTVRFQSLSDEIALPVFRPLLDSCSEGHLSGLNHVVEAVPSCGAPAASVR